MIGPFNLMPMCDCTVDPITKKKVCKPFLRAYVLDCNGLKAIGDYDYDAKLYQPTGEVSSEAKCCDCADCECEKEKSKACYDIHCLLRDSELNGGLTNLHISGPDGVEGVMVSFDPPARDVETVVEKLNSISYLGYTSWTSSGPGWLCVEFEKGQNPPGQLSSCRFKRFTVTAANLLPISWYGQANAIGFATCADNFAANDPLSLPANITTSNIHYLCNVRYTDTYTNNQSTAAPGNLTNDRLFRTTFNSSSRTDYVHLSILNTATDVLGGTLISAGTANVANAFPQWLAAVLLQQGISTNIVLSTTTASTAAGNGVTAMRFNILVDLPCRYVLNSINNLTAKTSANNSNFASSIEVNNLGIISGIGTAANHLHTFTQISGVGTFLATPVVDGVGGNTNTDADCMEISQSNLGGEFSTARNSAFDCCLG